MKYILAILTSCCLLVLFLVHFSGLAMAQQVIGTSIEVHNSPSVFSLFWQASFIVQLVMVGLIFASVWCWAIIFDKFVLVARTKNRMKKFEKKFWSGESLENLYQAIVDEKNKTKKCPMSALFVAAMAEWRRSFLGSGRPIAGIQMRIDKALEIALNKQMERLEKSLLYLASLGSAAPFVGLFGTVIGIMGSFQAIAGSKSTNLAVVAPGIAEALLATALGLLAAIPAVIAYNKFSGDMANISARLSSFADEFSAILSRQVEEK